MLENIRIVLIEPSHTGNIGSAARAMKTMGLHKLYLVSPKSPPDSHAVALAAGAEDVLKHAVIVDTFDQAVNDCTTIIGTSARLRHLEHHLMSARECGQVAIETSKQHQVAIIFGRERIGLTNNELQQCHHHLIIPTNPDYSSLNLAMAVQLVSYEIRMSWLNSVREKTFSPLSAIDNNYPTFQETEAFFSHTERVYQRLGFIKNQGIMKKLRRLYQRAKIEKNELNILRGMLSCVEKSSFFKTDNNE